MTIQQNLEAIRVLQTMQFTPFTKADWECWAGTESGDDGTAPLIAYSDADVTGPQLSKLPQGQSWTAIIDASGIALYLLDAEKGENRGYLLSNTATSF